MVGVIRRNGAKRWPGALFQVFAAAMLAADSGYAQLPPTGGQVSIPQSSIEKPGDTGVRAHTNIQIFIPNQGAGGPPALFGKGGQGTAPQQAPGPKGTGDIARPQ